MKFDNINLNYIVVTGATGWVGRTALHELQRTLPKDIFLNHVRAFASKNSQISASFYNDNTQILIYPLKELPNFARKNKLSAIFHSAFLRREKISSIGLIEYLNINKEINEMVTDAMKLWNDAKIVYISSGVARKYENKKNLDSLINSDPYGILKIKDEVQIQKYRNSLVLRIYALSGRFMNEPNIFALGNFIIKAMQNEKIQITSQAPVIRSYGNASDICKFALSWLFDENHFEFNSPINAVSFTIELDKLAQEVSKFFKSQGVVCNWDLRSKPNSYIAEIDTFINSLKYYGLKPKSLIEQIKDSSININKDIFC